MSPEDEAESDLEEHLRPMTPEERANYKAPTDEDIRLASDGRSANLGSGRHCSLKWTPIVRQPEPLFKV